MGQLHKLNELCDGLADYQARLDDMIEGPTIATPFNEEECRVAQQIAARCARVIRTLTSYADVDECNAESVVKDINTTCEECG